MKKITTVLFDLDGTLIRMDQDRFVKEYFSSIISKLTSFGYDGELMHRALVSAVRAVFANDGEMSNEERFWTVFSEVAGDVGDVGSYLESFYENEFVEIVKNTCESYPRTREVLDRVKKCGLSAVLATNPLFPMIATRHRIALGGMLESDFQYVTAYENSSYSKPNPEYFSELLSKLGLSADECVMIGNDTTDDLAAYSLGIPVFFLTECLINKQGLDLSNHPHGGFDELIDYIGSLNK